ncbi:Tripartite tricarboxylate transporter TctB family protein [Blastococcus aggregatus]|uniref:Tripartite tricarboxylate transporter TctB family protein n=1 Tax=Blastococcus aggregatus TaxID=38502 RepID=A0A285V8X7_9ACTN|nr:tripartite tricarboxylate transporter TctB family protein [Blastococcus aggregatus]SOC49506.1 Tripartite tricarboxylate transporter TctB family protein [Blastococcus aggregatus]
MTTPDTPAGTAPAAPTARQKTEHRLPVVDIVISLGLAALFGNAFWIATEWSERAGLFPRMVTLLGVALALLHVVMLLLRARRAVPVVESRVDADDEAEGDVEYVFAHAGGRVWAGSLAWVAAFFVGLYVVGLFVTAPLFAFTYLKLSVRRSWVFSLVYAAVVFAVLYLAFEVALQLQVPPGLFF